jgi:hypothetical protein
MINLRNKICHKRDQPLKYNEGRGAITTYLGHMWSTPCGWGCRVGINTPISMVYPWQRDMLMYSAYGFGGGGW